MPDYRSPITPYPSGHGVAVRPSVRRPDLGYDSTLYHVVVIGQSNAGGTDAILPPGWPFNPGGALSTQPVTRTRAGHPDCYMLAQGVRPLPAASYTTMPTVVSAGPRYYSLRPLFEQTDTEAAPHSETVGWGLSYRLARYGISTIVSASAVDGTEYASMAKGDVPFRNTLEQVSAAKELARRAGRPYRVLCFVLLHGEADQSFGRVNYNLNLATWRSDYEAAIRPLTGQSEEIPFYFSQQTSGAPNASGVHAAGTNTAYMMWLANKADPDRLVLIGARYHLSSRQSDGSSIHISPWAQRFHGEEFGRAIYQHQFLKKRFRPVAPIPGTVNFDGVPGSAASTTLEAEFYSPTGGPVQLAYDYVGRIPTTAGFGYFDDTSPPTITAVSQIGPNRLRFTLSGTPTGTANTRALRVAFGSATGTNNGPFAGDTSCNLCDCVTTLAYGGDPLRSWAAIAHEGVT